MYRLKYKAHHNLLNVWHGPFSYKQSAVQCEFPLLPLVFSSSSFSRQKTGDEKYRLEGGFHQRCRRPLRLWIPSQNCLFVIQLKIHQKLKIKWLTYL